jgi:hypothetical protein
MNQPGMSALQCLSAAERSGLVHLNRMDYHAQGGALFPIVVIVGLDAIA